MIYRNHAAPRFVFLQTARPPSLFAASKMITNTAILALTALFQVANSAPSDDNKAVKPNPNLRLVKTAEEDVGRWVTEAQKFELFTSKRIGFYDITDIQVRLHARSCSPAAALT